MLRRIVFTALATAFLIQPALAGDESGITFSHDDWEIACDNTRTCRAAGYQSDEDELSVSVLLTRRAGAGEPVKGQLTVGNFGDDGKPGALPSASKVKLEINKKGYGDVPLDKELAGDLSNEQVTALLGSLARKSRIEFVLGKYVWHLSDKGAAAVLLKMDEFQGRIGTTGAIMKKGPKNEDKVLPALSKPVIVVPKVLRTKKSETRLSANEAKALIGVLRRTTNKDDCPVAFEKVTGELEVTVASLTNAKSLVSMLCWRAAYNEGYGYWVVNDTGPKNPALVTTSATEYDNGEISSSQKGRGLGDCWSSDNWVWNGKTFVHSASSSTGMCKLVAPGGAWSLPALVSEIRYE